MQPLEGKRVLVTGGTGSLGQALVARLLTGQLGRPAMITVFSRDETKQHYMRAAYLHRPAATAEVINGNVGQLLEFRVGDVRDFSSIAGALRSADVVFNAAALKQVPTCEYAPVEAVLTNVMGPENIVRAIEQLRLPVETVVAVSTDKACKPVNVMGMTKALQERVLIQGNLRCRDTRFVCVRYGNVLASRGSVIPLFLDQIRRGGPITLTSPAMTRFLLSLEEAVDAVFAAVCGAARGETFVPRASSALVKDIAEVLRGDRPIPIVVTGVRPGEKTHEILVSEEEGHRTVERGGYCVILPILPELRGDAGRLEGLEQEYSSADHLMGREDLRVFFERHGLLGEGVGALGQELL
jgi:FlaA1/EpsC-like NDP-sugar epimerase